MRGTGKLRAKNVKFQKIDAENFAKIGANSFLRKIFLEIKQIQQKIDIMPFFCQGSNGSEIFKNNRAVPPQNR